MLRQQRHPAEGLAARVAGVLLDLAVSLQMGPEITSVGERAVAVLTAERLLAGVRTNVTLEQPRPGKRLAAHCTLARQRVRSDVHLERAQTDVHLVAGLAREGLLRLALGGRAVELPVLGQAGERGVGLAAVRALVPRRGRARGRGVGRAALLNLRVDDRRAGGGAARGRSAALAAGRGEVFRRDGWRRPQRPGTHGTRGRQATMVRTVPVRIVPGHGSWDRRAG